MATISEKLIAHIGLNTAAFTKGIKKVVGESGRIGEVAGTTFGTRFLKGAALPAIVTGFATAATKMASSFEYGMYEVWTLLDTTREQFHAMSDDLLDLSAKMGMATADMTKSLYDSVSAGIEAGKAIEFMEVASKAAIAGVTDTKVAVDALTSTLNAYGLGAEEAVHFSDAMFAAVIKGKTTFPELADSVGKIGAIAAKAGVAFEDLMAAFATTTRQGMRAQTAMMTLRQALNAIIKPTVASAAFAEKLGLDFSAAALKARGLHGVLKDVRIATKGNIESMTKLFPNIRALSGVMGLAGASAHQYDEILNFIADSSGRTETAFQKMEETTSRHAAKLWSELRKLGIELGTEVLPHLKTLLIDIKAVVIAFGEWSDKVNASQRAIAVLQALWGSFGAGIKFVTAVVLYGVHTIIRAFEYLQLALKIADERGYDFYNRFASGMTNMTQKVNHNVLEIIGVMKRMALLDDEQAGTMSAAIANMTKENEGYLSVLNKRLMESEKKLKEYRDELASIKWDEGGLKEMADALWKEASEQGADALANWEKAFSATLERIKKMGEDSTKDTEDEADKKVEVYDKAADERRRIEFEAIQAEKKLVEEATDFLENEWQERAATFKDNLTKQVRAAADASRKIKKLQKDTLTRSEEWEERGYRIKIAILNKEGKLIQTVGMARSYQQRAFNAANRQDFEESRRLFDKAVDYYEMALQHVDADNRNALIRAMETAHAQATIAHKKFIEQEKGKREAALQSINDIQAAWNALRHEFEEGLNVIVKNEEALDAVNEIRKAMRKLTDRTITITIKTVEAKQHGGIVGGMLPRKSGTDTIAARLTPGEFVVNRKATRENLDLLRAINAGAFRPRERMVFPSRSETGSVPGPVDQGDVHIHINSVVTRDVVRNVVIPEIAAAKRRGWQNLGEGR